jgi:hypothetical protein
MNVSKLNNLKKRLIKDTDDPECPHLCKILGTIEECLVDAKKKAKEADAERRLSYQWTKVECEYCYKEVYRACLYKHHRSKVCGFHDQNENKKPTKDNLEKALQILEKN